MCFTEDAAGLEAGVEVRPLPTLPEEWKGWWYKACLFSPRAGLQGHILYLDLDTVRPPHPTPPLPPAPATPPRPPPNPTPGYYRVRRCKRPPPQRGAQVLTGSLAPLATYRGGFALLAAAGFRAEEGNADGYNSSVMLWDAGDGDAGDGGAAALRALHDGLTPDVFRCLMRWDHWI